MQRIDDWFSFDIESETLCAWGDDCFVAALKRDRASGLERLSVWRKGYGEDAQAAISWEDLQRIKNECLGEERECIELYPKEADVVNRNNERHLWLYDGDCPYRFPKEAATGDDEALAIILEKLGLSGIADGSGENG